MEDQSSRKRKNIRDKKHIDQKKSEAKHFGFFNTSY